MTTVTLNEHLEQGTLPSHLQARHFDPDAEVPSHMIEDPNWMNHTGLLDQAVYVRFNGGIHPITTRINLDRVLSGGGIIVPAPPPEG
jgi:hypothetical protein